MKILIDLEHEKDIVNVWTFQLVLSHENEFSLSSLNLIMDGFKNHLPLVN